jgi:hypothetical protein
MTVLLQWWANVKDNKGLMRILSAMCNAAAFDVLHQIQDGTSSETRLVNNWYQFRNEVHTSSKLYFVPH